MRNSIRRISHCCSPPERGFVPPEQRTFRRVNGLQLPLHPLQLFGWLVLIGIVIGTFLVLIPRLSPKVRVPLLVVTVVLLVIHFISHLATSLVDPAEAKVREQGHAFKKPEFDRSKHSHVIEHGRCHLCNIDVSGKRTKHCWDCNKCVVGFDHHCKWLNNCIGSRNYSLFLVCVVSAVTSTLTVFGVAVTELANASALLCYQNATMDNTTLSINLPLSGTGSLIVISIVGVLSAIAAVLLIHLCLFHGYIACLGVTTYEYVRSKRDKNPSNALSKSSTLSKECPSFCNNSNGPPVRYHFCESVSSPDGKQVDARNVYICSTHGQENVQKPEGESSIEKDKKKFHLYFSYESQANETTSIELTSRTILADNSQNPITPIELKPSTPSPVSCCFSIISPSSTNAARQAKHKKRHNGETYEQERTVTRSCTTMRRIQTFLRTKLRKSARQRALNLDGGGARKNKVTPLTSPESADKDDSVKSISVALKDDSSVQVRPPPRLPPMVLPPKQRAKQSNQGHPSSTSAVSKRNQQHLRVRRGSLRKRPRFKMENHVTQSAQLSPIPESEQSIPASPLTSSQSNHFTFPPLRN